MSFTDEEIKIAVIHIMNKYDINSNGSIEGKERYRLIEDLKA